MLSRHTALKLMQAIPASLRPLLTISEALLSFAYLMATSISVHLRRSRCTPLPTLARLRPKQNKQAPEHLFQRDAGDLTLWDGVPLRSDFFRSR